MGCDFKNDTDIFVGEGLVQGPDICSLALVDKGHLLADKQLAHFIVGDINLRSVQDFGAGGLAQKLDQKIHVNGAAERAGTQIAQDAG